MEILGTIINAAVVAAVGVMLAWLGNGRFKQLHAEMDRRFDEVERRMDGFQRSLDSMRSDLTHVALAVGARRRAAGQER